MRRETILGEMAMSLFPLAVSFVAAIVLFAGVSFVLNYYRGRYENVEMNAALVISGGTFLFLATMFYGPNIFATAGELVLGTALTVIVLLVIVLTYRVLKADKPQTDLRN
jgi:O-antigen/teichoic acid export membrane protein